QRGEPPPAFFVVRPLHPVDAISDRTAAGERELSVGSSGALAEVRAPRSLREHGGDAILGVRRDDLAVVRRRATPILVEVEVADRRTPAAVVVGVHVEGLLRRVAVLESVAAV